VKHVIPKEVSLGGHSIKVIRKEGLLEHAEAYGIFDGIELTITIDKSLNDTMAWETFWHEIVEAINFFSEADLEHRTIQIFGLLLHQTVNSVLSEQQAKKTNKKAVPK